jgi:hypothetical protein
LRRAPRQVTFVDRGVASASYVVQMLHYVCFTCFVLLSAPRQVTFVDRGLASAS